MICGVFFWRKGLPFCLSVKNPPVMQETQVRSLGWEDPLEKGMATHSSVPAWRIAIDRGARWATVPGVAESDWATSEQMWLPPVLKRVNAPASSSAASQTASSGCFRCEAKEEGLFSFSPWGPSHPQKEEPFHSFSRRLTLLQLQTSRQDLGQKLSSVHFDASLPLCKWIPPFFFLTHTD